MLLSAWDRAATALTLVHPDKKPNDWEAGNYLEIITKKNTKDAGKDTNGRHLTLDLKGKTVTFHRRNSTSELRRTCLRPRPSPNRPF